MATEEEEEEEEEEDRSRSRSRSPPSPTTEEREESFLRRLGEAIFQGDKDLKEQVGFIIKQSTFFLFFGGQNS